MTQLLGSIHSELSGEGRTLIYFCQVETKHGMIFIINLYFISYFSRLDSLLQNESRCAQGHMCHFLLQIISGLSVLFL